MDQIRVRKSLDKNSNGNVARVQTSNGEVKPSEQAKDVEARAGLHRAMWIVFISLIIDLLAFTVILPLLPSLLEFYGNKEDWLYSAIIHKVDSLREALNMPDTKRFNAVLFGGFIGSLFSFLQFICCPLVGAASDVMGRRPVMLISMFGVLLSYAIWICSSNFTIFVLARIIGGLSKGNVTVCTAIVTDVTTSKTRGKGMALIGVAYSVGFIVGPIIGAVFAKRSSLMSSNLYLYPAMFALLLIVGDLLFVYLCLAETLPKEKRAKSLVSEFKNASHLINPVSLFRFDAMERSNKEDTQVTRSLGLVYFLYLFCFSGLEFTLTFLTHQNFNYSSMQQGMMFFYMGMIMALLQGGYVRRLPAGTEKKTAFRGMVAIIPSMLLVGTAKSSLTLYGGLALYSYGAATVVPCLTTLMSRQGTDDQKGKLLGILRSIGALARAVGPFVCCTMYWSIGSFWCYTIGAFLFLIPICLLKNVPL